MAAGPIESLVGAVCCFGAWWWIWLFVVAVRNRRAFVRLDEVPPLPEPSDTWPEVAILFAARDEEKSVARAVRSMLDQNYPPLRVVAVNDRSSDSTGAILDALAGRTPG
ncbi:MAG: glycosyltransferase [Isosphaeraceae bacterium]